MGGRITIGPQSGTQVRSATATYLPQSGSQRYAVRTTQAASAVPVPARTASAAIVPNSRVFTFVLLLVPGEGLVFPSSGGRSCEGKLARGGAASGQLPGYNTENIAGTRVTRSRKRQSVWGGYPVSRSLSPWQAILLGLVVLTSLGLGGVGLFAIGNRQWLWNESFHIQVGFRQVRGVEVGTRVRVRGMDAGEVVGVQVPSTPEGDVVLRLRIDGKLRHLVRNDATAQIVGEGMIGGKIVEIHPGSENAPVVADNAAIASKPAAELNDVVAQVDGVLQDLRKGQGTLGKLATDDKLYAALLRLSDKTENTMTSIQQDADALKDLPLVRNYVKDAHKLLVRPDCERNRQWFVENDLFETGGAVLTSKGRQELDKLVPWLEGLKHKGSDVVVASYQVPGSDAKLAMTVSQKQSDAVCAYLKDNHAVQKMGWFSRRKVTPIGLGANPAPAPDKDKLPAPRVEVLVFVPQG